VQLTRAKGRAKEVLILGASGCPNSSDPRGSFVPELIKNLQDLGVHVALCEPHASLEPALLPCEVEVVSQDVLESRIYDGIIVTVAHKVFSTPRYTDALGQHTSEGGILLDLPAIYKDHGLLDRAAGGTYWHL
jgi:UDP-N-acetyl-D-mannosaminuronate dehydrogenase